MKEVVRVGALCALRSVEAAHSSLALTKLGDRPLPWTLETPVQSLGQPSVLKLPESLDILKNSRVATPSTVQCHSGATTTKVHGFHGHDGASNGCEEMYAPMQIIDNSMVWSRSWKPHPTPRGKQFVILSKEDHG